MKAITKTLGVYITIFMVTASIAYGQTTVNVKAKVPLTATVTVVRDLDFGTVLPGSPSSTGATSGSNGLVKIVTNGDASHSISIAWTTINSLTSGSNSIDFEPEIKGSTVAGGAEATTIISGNPQNLSATGEYYIFVGGTLSNADTVPDDQAPGDYSGSITFTISKN